MELFCAFKRGIFFAQIQFFSRYDNKLFDVFGFHVCRVDRKNGFE